jgi:HEAT repeat protein
MLQELRCLWGDSMTQHGWLIALLLVFPGGESVAGEQPGAPETEPLILQVSVDDIRHEIRVVEQSDFSSVTDTERGRLSISGRIGTFCDGKLQTNVKTLWQEYGGSGFGSGGNDQLIDLGQVVSGVGSMPSGRAPVFWIRRGVSPLPTLVDALRRHDANSAGAAWRLGDMGPAASQAVSELTTVLGDEKATLWLREHAAVALGKIGPAAKDAVPQLLQLTAQEPPDRLRIAAALALWEIANHREAISSLVSATEDSDRVVRVKALEALAEIAVESPGVGQKMGVHLKDPDGRIRATAAHILWLSARDERSIDVLIEILERRLSGYHAAIEMLGKIGYPAAHPATPALAAVAIDSHPLRHTTVAEVLARVDPGAQRTLPYLLDLLRENDGKQLSEASEILATMGPPVLPALRGLLAQENPHVRCLALSTFGHMGLPALSSLAEALRHNAPSVREEAAHQLHYLLYCEVGKGSFRNEWEGSGRRPPCLRATVAPTLRALVLALEDDVKAVRTAAASALMDVGPPAIPAVRAALDSADPRARRRVRRIRPLRAA